MGRVFTTARSGPGRADRRGEANLDGEDRCENIGEEGKAMSGRQSIPETEQAERDAICQPWFYLRLLAYSFFRLSEGA